jgi:ribulose 1,5-bisphosphate synthetase/thiazole synthase
VVFPLQLFSLGFYSRQEEAATMSTVLETDIFIVGAGPAGGSLASFLAQNGTSTSNLQKLIF